MSAALNIELFVRYMNGCPVVSGNITYSLFYNHIFLVRPQGYVMPLSSSIFFFFVIVVCCCKHFSLSFSPIMLCDAVLTNICFYWLVLTCDVMVSLVALSTVDHGFKPWSGQTKDYKIGMCC